MVNHYSSFFIETTPYLHSFKQPSEKPCFIELVTRMLVCLQEYNFFAFMEQKFNRHHNIVSLIFKPSQQALTKDYRNRTEKRTQDYILHQTENVTYNVFHLSTAYKPTKLEIPTNQRLNHPLNI